MFMKERALYLRKLSHDMIKSGSKRPCCDRAIDGR
jgi:hypothetical protein